MHIHIPSAYEGVVCPSCGHESRVTVLDGWAYWLADVWWRCPYCRGCHTTEELHARERAAGAK